MALIAIVLFAGTVSLALRSLRTVLALVGSLQEKMIALQGGKAEGPFVTAENIANGAQKLTETLGYKTPGLFFQPADRVVANAALPAPPPPQPAPSPELLAAQAQIEILRQAAAADMQIKREKAQADIAIAEFKARQWAEIERFKVGLKASLQADAEQGRGIS